MKTIKSKLKEVIRNQPSCIRVRFEEPVFSYTDCIISDRRFGTEYYISNKQDDIYDIVPKHFQNETPDNSDLRVGKEFKLMSIIVGEFDDRICGMSEE